MSSIYNHISLKGHLHSCVMSSFHDSHIFFNIELRPSPSQLSGLEEEAGTKVDCSATARLSMNGELDRSLTIICIEFD